MNSLRGRLIVGAALIAIIPLAAAMLFMTGRVRSLVHQQATEQVEGVTALIDAELHAHIARIDERIDLVAADPQLARLHRLKPASGQGLIAYLEEKRPLIGLDTLEVGSAGVTPGDFIQPVGDGRALQLVVVRASGDPPAFTVRGTLRLDARFLDRLRETSGVDLVLRDAEGRTWATTLSEDLEPFVPLMESPEAAGLEQPSHIVRAFEIRTDGPRARVIGLVSLAPVDAIITALQGFAILLGLAGVGVAIVLGILWSRQVTRPVEKMAAFSERVARGDWDVPLELQSVDELQVMAHALERMRADLRDYRDRILATERQAAWGVMARTVAHEIRNPLTPIAVSISDLKRSYAAQREDFAAVLEQAVKTIDAEVRSLNRLLSEFAELGQFPAPVLETVDLADVLADLAALYRTEVTSGRLIVSRPEAPLRIRVDPGQIRQVLVNLVKNGLEATGAEGRVEVGLRTRGTEVVVSVADDGPGLTEERRAVPFTPGFTTKAGGSGLGLMIVERIVTEHGGTIRVHSATGQGTRFDVSLPQNEGAP